MSDMSADKVMLNFEKSGKSKDLEAIAVQYDAINKHRLDRLEESGLINPVMRKQWETSALTKIDPPVLKIIDPPSAQFLRFMPSDFS